VILEPINKEDAITVEIIEDFKPKIKKCLRNTSFQEQEDLEQEIKLKIIEKMKEVNFKEPPSIWSFLHLPIR